MDGICKVQGKQKGRNVWKTYVKKMLKVYTSKKGFLQLISNSILSFSTFAWLAKNRWRLFTVSFNPATTLGWSSEAFHIIKLVSTVWWAIDFLWWFIEDGEIETSKWSQYNKNDNNNEEEEVRFQRVRWSVSTKLICHCIWSKKVLFCGRTFLFI